MIVGPAAPEPDTVFWQWFTWMQGESGQAVVKQRFSGLDVVDVISQNAAMP